MPNEALRQELLPAAADGSLHVCFAMTEPDAGTDATRIRTVPAATGPTTCRVSQHVRGLPTSY